jgi:hypothetical protein
MAREALATEEARAARAARESSTLAAGARRVEIDLRDFPPGLIAVPTTDVMWTEAAIALMQLRGTTPPGTELQLMPQTASTIATKRTALVECFLAKPHLKWLFFLDSDMTPPVHAIAQLLAHKLDIVAGLCCLRQPPYPPAVTWLDGIAPPLAALDRPVAIEKTGLACALITRRVLETVRAPWFAENPANPGLGEDTYFFRRARAAGFTVYLDMQLHVGHLGVTAITPDFSAAYAQTPQGRCEHASLLALGEIARTTPAVASRRIELASDNTRSELK